MLQIEEALSILTGHSKTISETISLPLHQAVGYVLAEDIIADHDQPPFPRSPLDGYAVRSADLAPAETCREHPVTLRVIGNIYAGEAFSGQVGPMEAVRLTTGAPIPDGADAIIRQEDTDNNQDRVTVYVTAKAYDNYCFQGEDYKQGDVLMKKGHVLHSGAICVLSSLGREYVNVFRKPSVAVISTGDEVLQPGDTWAPGKIFDSNRYYITSRFEEHNNPVTISRQVGDDPQRVADAIAEASKTCDFIITTGGVSVGEKDILHEVVRILDANLLFWRIFIKPGSPTMAFMYNDTLVLCLSGNPYGAIANFELLARPVMEKLSNNPVWATRRATAILENDFKKKAGSRRFLRGYYENGAVYLNGSKQNSGAISAMADCNCLVEITPNMSGAEKGNQVTVYQIF